MKILLFGATGSVGNSVLEACLAASIVDEVRSITRRPLLNTDAKLRTTVHKDFLDFSTAQEAFRDIDACLFCLGTSITQVSKEEYRKISYAMPLAAAQMLKARSPSATFHYVSGKGTTPHSSTEWARVKAQAEYDLMIVIEANCWRPGFVHARPSDHMPKMYRLIYPLGTLFKAFASLYVEGHDLGRAMLQATKEGMRKRVIENLEIRAIAARSDF